jgi:hypothetical protein
VSDSYPNLFAPAGLTFSIWGIIYLLLGLYTIYQLGCFCKSKKRAELINKIGIYFSLSSLFNAFWIFSWHYGFIALSLLWIVLILFCLIKIADLLNKEKFLGIERLFILAPFSVYFGWITVAVIANVTVLLVKLGFSGLGIAENIWMIIVLLIATAIGLWRMFKDRSILYGVVFLWAYTGILIKHLSLSGFSGKYMDVILTTAICMVLFLASCPFLCRVDEPESKKIAEEVNKKIIQKKITSKKTTSKKNINKKAIIK